MRIRHAHTLTHIQKERQNGQKTEPHKPTTKHQLKCVARDFSDTLATIQMDSIRFDSIENQHKNELNFVKQQTNPTHLFRCSRQSIWKIARRRADAVALSGDACARRLHFSTFDICSPLPPFGLFDILSWCLLENGDYEWMFAHCWMIETENEGQVNRIWTQKRNWRCAEK